MTQLKLPVGTLLLDPTGHGSPILWCVKSANKLVCVRDAAIMEATLSKPGVPEGWKVIENGALARELAKHLADLETRKMPLPSLFQEAPDG